MALPINNWLLAANGSFAGLHGQTYLRRAEKPWSGDRSSLVLEYLGAPPVRLFPSGTLDLDPLLVGELKCPFRRDSSPQMAMATSCRWAAGAGALRPCLSALPG